jgi:hypothetical protein
VPSPATLPLFATGLGMMALLGWRRSRLRLNLTDIIGGHMNRWIMMCLAVAAISIGATGANAGFITQAAFGPSAVTTDLDNLGLQQANYPAPFTVGIYTFTTDDGQVRYATFGINNSFALGDNTDLGFIDITLSEGVVKFGFLAGLAGEAQVNSQTVSFFDTNNNLLGTSASSRDGGFTFFGFENPGGLIGRALITDTKLNSTVVTVENLVVQQVPEPSTLG